MPYLILFIVIFIFMGFSLVFQWLLQDNPRHLYIVGLTLFYALCTLIRRSPVAAHFIGNITHGWALIIYALSLMLSIWCSVCYLMNIINDQKFRVECGFFMLADLIILSATAVMRYYQVNYYMQVFFVAILIVSILSIIMGIYYTVKCWKIIQYHDKILLIATFCMIGWFINSLVLNLKDAQYVYVCGTGIMLYFIVYIVVSAMRLRNKITGHNQSGSVISDTAENDNTLDTSLILRLTRQEKVLLNIMSEHNTVISKDILTYLSEDASESGVNSAVSRMMKKFNVVTREELIEKWDLVKVNN